MTIDKQGKFDLSYTALGKLVLAMAVGASVPVTTAMVVMYGDKRVMESTQASQAVTLERHSEKLDKHESRITTLEARNAIEE